MTLVNMFKDLNDRFTSLEIRMTHTVEQIREPLVDFTLLY